MPIRLIDRVARFGPLTTTFDALTSNVSGTHTRPANRTGSIATNLGALTGNFSGFFTPAQNRTGTIGTALAALTSNVTGTFTAPGNRPPTAPNPITLSGLTQGVAFSFDLDSVCSDPDGDSLTYILVGTMPSWMTQSGTRGNLLSGTPTASGSFSFDIDIDDGLVIVVPTWTSSPVL